MDPGALIQGTRYAIVQWVEKLTIVGKPHYRIVFRFVNDNATPARDTVVKAEQIYRHPHMGDLIRVHFCLSRVLRIEKGS